MMGYVFTIEENEALSTYFGDPVSLDEVFYVDETTYHVCASRFGEKDSWFKRAFNTRNEAAAAVQAMIELKCNPTTQPEFWS